LTIARDLVNKKYDSVKKAAAPLSAAAKASLAKAEGDLGRW